MTQCVILCLRMCAPLRAGSVTQAIEAANVRAWLLAALQTVEGLSRDFQNHAMTQRFKPQEASHVVPVSLYNWFAEREPYAI